MTPIREPDTVVSEKREFIKPNSFLTVLLKLVLHDKGVPAFTSSLVWYSKTFD